MAIKEDDIREVAEALGAAHKSLMKLCGNKEKGDDDDEPMRKTKGETPSSKSDPKKKLVMAFLRGKEK